MIDTHTHLYLPEFEDGGEAAVLNAVEKGVSAFIFPNVNADTLIPMMELRDKFPERSFMAFGLHPTDVKNDWKSVIDNIIPFFKKEGTVAVGEVGIDLYWDKTFRSDQMDAFSFQLDLAERMNLPVIIHCREALEETLEVIEDRSPTVPLVFHSFTGNRENVERIRKSLDPFFGINGVVTYKNAESLRQSLPEIGIERIVLETDSPYLAPVPKRGKRNESAYLPFIRDKVAECLGLTSEQTDLITDRNARNVFLSMSN